MNFSKKKNNLYANVSHELLTPIALLKNKFENLLQNDSLDDNAIDKIAGSLRTLDMLKKIINNLLLISRIENHQYEANETIDLEQILNDLQRRFEGSNGGKRIDFKNESSTSNFSLLETKP